jgi:hypothetical protein
MGAQPKLRARTPQTKQMTAASKHVPAPDPSRAPKSSLALPTPYLTFNDFKMPFAQLVIGPPGSGKSTYCDGMQQFMGAIERKCSIVNLDPANDHTSYQPAVDVRDLVTIDEIMEQESLGPNGGVLFALEELENNFDWLAEGLKELEGLHKYQDKGHTG